METNMQAKPTYGLVTAIAMIVGIVIGSGIYFKVDDILNFAGGNVWLGMLVIALGAVSIVFGSLSISELALRSAASGGIFRTMNATFTRGWQPPLACLQPMCIYRQ